MHEKNKGRLTKTKKRPKRILKRRKKGKWLRKKRKKKTLIKKRNQKQKGYAIKEGKKNESLWQKRKNRIY